MPTINDATPFGFVTLTEGDRITDVTWWGHSWGGLVHATQHTTSIGLAWMPGFAPCYRPETWDEFLARRTNTEFDRLPEAPPPGWWIVNGGDRIPEGCRFRDTLDFARGIWSGERRISDWFPGDPVLVPLGFPRNYDAARTVDDWRTSEEGQFFARHYGGPVATGAHPFISTRPPRNIRKAIRQPLPLP